jgi:hypothetical protein
MALMYPRMAAVAFAEALTRLRLSHYQASVLLGKETRLTRDWASGRKPIPHPIAAWLIWRLMIKERLFEMFTAGCGATRSSIIEWNREVSARVAAGANRRPPAIGIANRARWQPRPVRRR